nr:hypothetical protein [Tanacetum cinerariifolium]
MVFHLVNGVRASCVEMIYEMDFVLYVIQEIHAFMILIRILSIAFPIIATLHTPHTRLTRVIHVEMILVLVMIFPVIHPPPQETSIEILYDQENAINSVQTFLRKFNRYSFFETPKVLLLAWDKVFKIKDAFENKQYKLVDIKELFRELFNDVQNIHEELAEYINTPGWNRPAFSNNGDDDDEDCTLAITPNEPVDSLIMGDEHLNTIPATKSDEFLKSSVEDLVPNPSEFEDECECDVPNCDDSQTTKFLTFSNHLFDDSTSSDDESSHEEVIHKMSFKTYSNPLFDLDEEIISSEFNPIHNEDLDSTTKNDRFDTKSYLLESLLNRDESIPPGIDSDDSDSEADTLSLERLLHDDLIPLPDTLDFSNVYSRKCEDSYQRILSSKSSFPQLQLGIMNLPDPGEWISILNSKIRENLSFTTRVNLPIEDDHSPLLAYVVWIFLAYVTYPIIPPYLHSFGNEDTIFDPGIAINRFYSFKPGLCHRSQSMLKSSYKAEDGVIISISSLVGGMADVVVEIKGT